ncbi:MAG: glycoside hydrolase family 25 protein [Chitinophagaceae bacterium]
MQRSENTFYKAFGITIPTKFNINGIDVSKHQGYIYWASVKKMKIDSISIDFAFMKATEGISDVDGMFKRNWELTKQSNIARGAYLYFIAAKDGKQQANNYIKNVQLEKGDLPPVIDVEENYNIDIKILRKRLNDCINTLQKKYGVKPIIYSYVDFYNNNLGEGFDSIPLWIAHYTDSDRPNISRNWLFWQHNDGGSVNGITEKVDFNVFNGDTLAFKKILIK